MQKGTFVWFSIELTVFQKNRSIKCGINIRLKQIRIDSITGIILTMTDIQDLSKTFYEKNWLLLIYKKYQVCK